MTLTLNKIAIANPPDTVLDYGITTNPDPLQVSTTGSIEISVSKSAPSAVQGNSIVVSKSSPPVVQCNSLVFAIAVGTSASTLTANASNILTTYPTGWSVKSDGLGTFTFIPDPGQGMIGPVGLSFALNNITVNDQVGTTSVVITENLTSGSKVTAPTLTKFPAGFTVSELTANSYSVEPGSNVILSWNGSAGADYSLSYDNQTLSNLPNIDSQTIPNLQTTTTFTLIVTADGGTTQIERQCTVTILQPQVLSLGIVGNPSRVVAGDTIAVYWTTQDCSQCSLILDGIPLGSNLPPNIEPSSGYAVTIPNQAGLVQIELLALGNNAGQTSKTLILQVFQLRLSAQTIPVSGLEAVDQLLISADDSRLYVSGVDINLSSLPLSVIATDRLAVIQTVSAIQVAKFAFCFFESYSIALSPDGSHLYYIADAGDPIFVMDTASYLIATAVTANNTEFLGVGSGTDRVNDYLIAWDANHLYLYNRTNNYTLSETVPTNFPAMRFLPSYAYNQAHNQFLLRIVAPTPQPNTWPTLSYSLSNPSQLTQISSQTIALYVCSTLSPDGSRYYTTALNSSLTRTQTPTTSYSDKISALLQKKPSLSPKPGLGAERNPPGANTLECREVATNQLLSTLTLGDDKASVQMVCSPDGYYLYLSYAASSGPMIDVYTTQSLKLVATLALTVNSRPILAIRNDGTALYVSSEQAIAIVDLSGN